MANTPRSSLAKLAIAATLLQPAAAAAQQPAYATAPVTADMVLAAISICDTQLRTGNFDADALTGLGWVTVIKADGEPIIRGYRHPDNMMMMQTIDSTRQADKCAVMAPTEMGLTVSGMRAAVEAQPGLKAKRDGDATRWTTDGLRHVLRPMGSAGVIIEIEAREL